MNDDLWSRVRVAAEMRSTSPSNLVRVAVQRYLEDNGLNDYKRGYEEGLRDALISDILG